LTWFISNQSALELQKDENKKHFKNLGEFVGEKIGFLIKNENNKNLAED
jgi:hypothetical protein